MFWNNTSSAFFVADLTPDLATLVGLVDGTSASVLATLDSLRRAGLLRRPSVARVLAWVDLRPERLKLNLVLWGFLVQCGSKIFILYSYFINKLEYIDRYLAGVSQSSMGWGVKLVFCSVLTLVLNFCWKKSIPNKLWLLIGYIKKQEF